WRSLLQRNIADKSDQPRSGGLIQISSSAYENVQQIRELMDSPTDLITKLFKIGRTSRLCAIVCIDGLVDKDHVNNGIIKNMMMGVSEANIAVPAKPADILSLLENEVLSVNDVRKVSDMDDVLLSILSGNTALFVDGTDQVLMVSTPGWASRGIEEPQTEALIR